MPLVEACDAAGVPYCDTTGEPELIFTVRERFSEGRAPLVPAAGFDYVPHDLVAVLAARSLDSVESIDTVMLVRNIAPTRGTLRSAVDAATVAMRVLDGGSWREERAAASSRTFSFPPPTGSVHAVSYGGGDAFQIANHTGASTVRTWAVLSPALARIAGPAARLGGRCWEQDRRAGS